MSINFLDIITPLFKTKFHKLANHFVNRILIKKKRKLNI